MKSIKEWLVESQGVTPLTLNPYNIFIMIKPGFLKKSDQIIDLLKKNGYEIAKYEAKRLTYDSAAELYKVHEDKPFFDELCKYTSSDWSAGYLMNYTGSGDPIKETDKIKDMVRDTFGKDKMRNGMHSSDSKENVEREARIYFNSKNR